jgi:hypothetical protein
MKCKLVPMAEDVSAVGPFLPVFGLYLIYSERFEEVLDIEPTAKSRRLLAKAMTGEC